MRPPGIAARWIRASSPLAGLRGEHWVALDDLDDVPRPIEVTPVPAAPLSERWPVSEVDGIDTYLWSHAPREVGVVAKFELSARDATKRRLVGDFFEPACGDGYRDVVAAVEPHFVPEMRFIRVVCLAAPMPDDPSVARGAAVRAYLDRCHRLALAPSGWVNQIEPKWWGGMPLDEVIRVADASGPVSYTHLTLPTKA